MLIKLCSLLYIEVYCIENLMWQFHTEKYDNSWETRNDLYIGAKERISLTQCNAWHNEAPHPSSWTHVNVELFDDFV